MFVRPQDGDTIIAVATPPGHGGISVIRVSGVSSLTLTKRFCSTLENVQVESHRCYFGHLHGNDGHLIDQVVITYFENGHSYTGETTVEISCHGNPLICEQIIELYNSNGTRLAEPGEFTYRSFMNGKIDLVQAEGVLEVIEGQSEKALNKSLGMLKGNLSKRLVQIKEDLIWILANMEAGIDFVEEDLNISEIPGLLDRCHSVDEELKILLSARIKSRIVFEGLKVGLFGLPNSGKSSIINSLSNSDVSIVTSHPGTTRDLIRYRLKLSGYLVEMVDTAGLRETVDEIEAIGVAKTHELLKEVDVIAYVFAPDLESDAQLIEIEKLQPDIIIFSKNDMIDTGETERFQILLNSKDIPVVISNSVDSTGLEALKVTLLDLINSKCSGNFGEVMILKRHHEFLQKCHVGLLDGIKMLKNDASPEFVIQALQLSLMALKEVLGERFDDEVMDRVFKQFCIGK